MNEQLDKEKHDLNITEDMLKGAMNQVVALSQELKDSRDLLAHSELDTSYYKKIGDEKIQKLEKEICELSIIQNNLQSELAQINESLDTEALYTQHLKLEQESFELELKKKEETIKHQMNTIINMETKIHKIKSNVAHKPRNVRKHPCFKLIRKNNNEQYQYVTVRAQRSGVGRAMRKIKSRYPYSKIVLELPYSANAVNLNNKIKEELFPLVKFNYNQMFSGFENENLLLARIRTVVDPDSMMNNVL